MENDGCPTRGEARLIRHCKNILHFKPYGGGHLQCCNSERTIKVLAASCGEIIKDISVTSPYFHQYLHLVVLVVYKRFEPFHFHLIQLNSLSDHVSGLHISRRYGVLDRC